MVLWWPVATPVAAAGLWREAVAFAEQSRPQLVESGAAHAQMRGGGGRIERARIEVGQDALRSGLRRGCGPRNPPLLRLCPVLLRPRHDSCLHQRHPDARDK